MICSIFASVYHPLRTVSLQMPSSFFLLNIWMSQVQGGRFTVASTWDIELILVLLFINSCIISHNICKSIVPHLCMSFHPHCCTCSSVHPYLSLDCQIGLSLFSPVSLYPCTLQWECYFYNGTQITSLSCLKISLIGSPWLYHVQN